ncbi:thiosulfate sulfurtransferase [Clostridium sp. WLY-B-L2]|uniref:Thiosulfate sulfurtransferase n=1 Tax=Clostridium aromativorans TaxID=2836848 RepID=A0ABS8N5T9_9CLOT|nr:rhodanese-like domain-containing protein [Clostridium aromativorans]MCC9295140.1 thiosulfate sulfurtransferase [Clostridium aromativorans]
MRKRIRCVTVFFTLLFFALAVSACSNGQQSKSDEGYKSISTKEVKDNLGKSNWVVVDTRENDAYIGWKLDVVKRGGHIKGAVDFSSAWLKVKDKDKDKRLKEALKTKKISSEKNIVLYAANGKDNVEVAKYLSKNGYKNLYTYDVKDWAKDTSLPMESYPNYQELVPVSWVKDLVDGKKPETYNGGKYKIFEVSWGDESKSPDYLKIGHIKGAVHINTDEVEEGPLWNRLSDARLQKFAENNGITTDTTVVLYGTDSMPSFRVAVILKYMGVKDVRVVNGGFTKWQNAGYALQKTSNPKTPVSSFGATVPVNKNYIIDLPQAKEILADKKGSKLVDVRSWDEYIGKISGYDYIKPKGRPAGAVWGHAGTDSSNLQDYRNLDNTMRNKDEILAMWKEWGITPDQRLAFFCGTGWRAAEALTYADVMGLKNISLYDGGWNEWSGNTGNAPNPIETGDPRK